MFITAADGEYIKQDYIFSDTHLRRAMIGTEGCGWRTDERAYIFFVAFTLV